MGCCKIFIFIAMIFSQEEIEESIALEAQVDKERALILFNDDVNTFDHVIETLMQVCEHTAEQAEQCAWIVHYKGKCTVKSGSYDFLKPKCLLLLEAGLSAEIE